MSIEALVTKYLAFTEEVLRKIERVPSPIAVDEEKVNAILDYVSAYLEDAKYYKAQKRFETSLTSVAYCEGLLDSLKLVGAVRFDWPSKKE